MSNVVLAAAETDRAKWLDSLKSGTVLLIPKQYIKTKCKQTGKKIHTHKKTTKNKKKPKNNKHRVYHCYKICLGYEYFMQVLRYD